MFDGDHWSRDTAAVGMIVCHAERDQKIKFDAFKLFFENRKGFLETSSYGRPMNSFANFETQGNFIKHHSSDWCRLADSPGCDHFHSDVVQRLDNSEQYLSILQRFSRIHLSQVLWLISRPWTNVVFSRSSSLWLSNTVNILSQNCFHFRRDLALGYSKCFNFKWGCINFSVVPKSA